MAWARDGAVRTATFVLAVTLLAACQHSGRWPAGDRTFETPEAALNHTRASYDSMIASIEPLPAPLAPSVIAVTPSKQLADRILRKANPRLSERVLDFLVEGSVLNWSLPSRQIEKRGIFESVQTVTSDMIDDVEMGPEDYVFWFEVRSRRSWFYRIRPPGGDNFTEISNNDQVTRNPDADVKLFLSALESFVRATAR